MENQIKNFQNVQVSEVFQLHGVSDEIATEYDRQQEQIAIQNKIKRSEIPLVFQKGFTDFVVDTVERQNLLNAMRNAFRTWTDKKPVTVCLLGDCGIGKTKLSNAFLMESLNYTKSVYDIPVHYSIRYKLMDDIVSEYEKAKSFTEKQTQEGVIEEYSDIDLLVLDEIGDGEKLDVQKLVLFKLLNRRNLKRKTQFLNSNFTFTEFAQFCGRKTMDRLKDTAIFPNTSGIKSFRGSQC